MIDVAITHVRYDDVASLAALVGPDPVDQVFTARERRLCGPASRLDSWAGRLAAKLSVRELLGGDVGALQDVEIVPEPATPCRDPRRCAMGHPPVARIRRRSGDDVDLIAVSISHDRGFAVAIACRTVAS